MLEDVEQMGGMFLGVPGKAQRPVYSCGPEGQQNRLLLFQCPQSAIPVEVWELLGVWNACRLMKTLPVGGGLLDQPVWVQRYFPVLDACLRVAEGGQGNTAERAAMLAVGTVVKAMGGGK